MDGWAVPENRALAWRPMIIGLPRLYFACLFGVVGLLGLSLDQLLAAAWLLAFGWGVGKLGLWFDPFAWELLPRRGRLPSVLRP